MRNAGDLEAQELEQTERLADTREKIAAARVLLGGAKPAPTTTGLGQRILEVLRATETAKPPGMNMTALAERLAIKDGSPERKALTAEVAALMKRKKMYRTAGGRYRATQRS